EVDLLVEFVEFGKSFIAALQRTPKDFHSCIFHMQSYDALHSFN
ncbi:MAG: hypothetical protein JWR18_3774, partial [Segetibacter sp.]|nr:hypothetical protein [Segetibacter sp.]